MGPKIEIKSEKAGKKACKNEGDKMMSKKILAGTNPAQNEVDFLVFGGGGLAEFRLIQADFSSHLTRPAPQAGCGGSKSMQNRPLDAKVPILLRLLAFRRGVTNHEFLNPLQWHQKSRQIGPRSVWERSGGERRSKEGPKTFDLWRSELVGRGIFARRYKDTKVQRTFS